MRSAGLPALRCPLRISCASFLSRSAKAYRITQMSPHLSSTGWRVWNNFTLMASQDQEKGNLKHLTQRVVTDRPFNTEQYLNRYPIRIV